MEYWYIFSVQDIFTVDQSCFDNLGFEESIQNLVTTDAQLNLDLTELSDTVLGLNVTLNSVSGQVSTLQREVAVLNDTVEQLTLSGTEFQQ